jgi:hypothetical protein
MRHITILFFTLVTLFVEGSLRAESPVGTWKGQWQSGANGHKGPMRAKISMKSDGSYQARFAGRFALVIPFVYRTDLHPSVDGAGNTVLTANKPLGPILGSYQMQAQVNGSQMSGNFQAAGDNGSIRMTRIR